MKAQPYKNPRAEIGVRLAGSNNYEDKDWLDLAMACLDQAGLDLEQQAKVVMLLLHLGYPAEIQ